jgi:hypothetical protein
MRMMGADSVAYHRETIIERGDDFPAAGLEYYASRGETPLLWGGMGAQALGLVGPVDNPSYDALYGPGGACDPATGERPVNSRRPGMEVVIAAHKSVAELGVLGQVEHMHTIMDAERDATLAYLDQLTRERGGRRGVAAVPTATPGQQAAVLGIATSGRGVELVEGVAGSGKTTVMATVRDAFESGGFTVIGTSTSGQAAWTLGREAGLEESRTLASLRWRIQHDRMHLTEHHVLVLDEAGMAGDRDIAFLLDHARMRGAKVVMVGDDRQLGAVSVGGAMGALIERHGGIVHVLEQNVRQHDEAEREALAELRAGDDTRAVGFYLDQDRVTTERTRDEALAKMVDQWAKDALDGRDAAMFAWRRANVAELNRLARERMVAEGRVTGPELVAPGGTHFAAGDRIVTLALWPMARSSPRRGE